jgi:hypothetical protein
MFNDIVLNDLITILSSDENHNSIKNIAIDTLIQFQDYNNDQLTKCRDALDQQANYKLIEKKSVLNINDLYNNIQNAIVDNTALMNHELKERILELECDVEQQKEYINEDYTNKITKYNDKIKQLQTEYTELNTISSKQKPLFKELYYEYSKAFNNLNTKLDLPYQTELRDIQDLTEKHKINTEIKQIREQMTITVSQLNDIVQRFQRENKNKEEEYNKAINAIQKEINETTTAVEGELEPCIDDLYFQYTTHYNNIIAFESSNDQREAAISNILQINMYRERKLKEYQDELNKMQQENSDSNSIQKIQKKIENLEKQQKEYPENIIELLEKSIKKTQEESKAPQNNRIVNFVKKFTTNKQPDVKNEKSLDSVIQKEIEKEIEQITTFKNKYNIDPDIDPDKSVLKLDEFKKQLISENSKIIELNGQTKQQETFKQAAISNLDGIYTTQLTSIIKDFQLNILNIYNNAIKELEQEQSTEILKLKQDYKTYKQEQETQIRNKSKSVITIPSGIKIYEEIKSSNEQENEKKQVIKETLNTIENKLQNKTNNIILINTINILLNEIKNLVDDQKVNETTIYVEKLEILQKLCQEYNSDCLSTDKIDIDSISKLFTNFVMPLYNEILPKKNATIDSIINQSPELYKQTIAKQQELEKQLDQQNTYQKKIQELEQKLIKNNFTIEDITTLASYQDVLMKLDQYKEYINKISEPNNQTSNEDLIEIKKLYTNNINALRDTCTTNINNWNNKINDISKELSEITDKKTQYQKLFNHFQQEPNNILCKKITDIINSNETNEKHNIKDKLEKLKKTDTVLNEITSKLNEINQQINDITQKKNISLELKIAQQENLNPDTRKKSWVEKILSERAARYKSHKEKYAEQYPNSSKLIFFLYCPLLTIASSLYDKFYANQQSSSLSH